MAHDTPGVMSQLPRECQGVSEAWFEVGKDST